MRLFTLLVLLFGIAHTSAYSIPGGYERVLIYNMYIIDAQLNGGTPKQVATGCRGTNGNGRCTLDELLRYIADNPNSLPQNRQAPAFAYPDLAPMDSTADELARKDTAGADTGKDFAGQITTGRTLPGSSKNYSTFLTQLADVAIDFALRSPDNANLLKINIQAIRNARRNAQLTTFIPKNPNIDVAQHNIPLYDGAPTGTNARTANTIDAPGTVSQNPGLTTKSLGQAWSANQEGGHAENVKSLGAALEKLENACS